MGRFSEPLSPLFADLLEVPPGSRVLDVGCGPGVLTRELVARHGAEHVSAIDPTPGFVEAARNRLPGVDLREGAAESLPYDDGSFDATYAQLVVHFMTDPAQGLAEMARVTRPGGGIAACVWDHPGGRGPLTAVLVRRGGGGSRRSRRAVGRRPRGAPGRAASTRRDSPTSGAASCRSPSASSRSRTGGRRTPSQPAPSATTWPAGPPSRSPSCEAHCRGAAGRRTVRDDRWTWTATGESDHALTSRPHSSASREHLRRVEHLEGLAQPVGPVPRPPGCWSPRRPRRSCSGTGSRPSSPHTASTAAWASARTVS